MASTAGPASVPRPPTNGSPTAGAVPAPAVEAAAAQTVQAIHRAIDAGALPSAIALGVERLRALGSEERGPILTALAMAYANNGQPGEALRAAAAARDLARERGDLRLEAEAVLAIAATLSTAEDHAGVIAQIEAVEPLLETLGDPALKSNALRRLGVSCSIVGDHARATDYLDRAHALLLAGGQPGQALSLRNSILNARVRRLDALAEDDPARGAGHAQVLDEWLDLARQQEAAGNLRLALMARGNYAICAWQSGQVEAGLAELDALLGRYAEAGMRPNVVVTQNHRGHALRRLNRHAAARAAYDAVLADSAASIREQREALEGLAAVHEALDDPRAALAVLKRVRELDRQINDAQARRQAEQRELRLEIARLNDHWSRLASEDPLTALPNRRALDTWLPAALARAADGQPLALLLIDVDHFKAVNDRFGHATGDVVLKQLAQLLRARCRYDDLPVRLGGEEFVLALPNTTIEHAIEAAQRLREAVARHRWGTVAPELAVTVSIGVTGSEALQQSALAGDTLLSLADRHLYAAKNAGRNRIAA